MNMYQNRLARKQYGERVVRESAVLRAADEVWSDVASTEGHGFRSNEAGPQLYGDFASGATFQLEILETEAGEYRTVGSVRREGPDAKGTLRIAPRDALSRVLALTSAAPGRPLLPEFSARFVARARSHAPIPPSVQETLVALSDRSPRLYGDDGAYTLVLEGVELVHERVARVVELLGALVGADPRGGGGEGRTVDQSGSHGPSQG